MNAFKLTAAALVLVCVGVAWWLTEARAQDAAARQRIAGEEIMIVEDVVSARKKCRESLEKLVAFYTVNKNEFKLAKAREELDNLNRVGQYSYVIIGESLGPDLRPSKSIPEAEKIFKDARKLDTLVGPGDVKARKTEAIELYLALISRYPESLRLSEAAYYLGNIYEIEIQDYYRAAVYYEKCFQWDPETPHPARIRAGRIAYTYLHDFSTARRFYEEAMNHSPSPAYRVEGKAMYVALKNAGY